MILDDPLLDEALREEQAKLDRFETHLLDQYGRAAGQLLIDLHREAREATLNLMLYGTTSPSRIRLMKRRGEWHLRGIFWVPEVRFTPAELNAARAAAGVRPHGGSWEPADLPAWALSHSAAWEPSSSS